MKRLLLLLLLVIPISLISAVNRNYVSREAYFLKNTVGPKLIRGPYLQDATDTSMLIRWRTDVLTRGEVFYGLDKNNLKDSVFNVGLTTEHGILITGLQPGTKYFYSIGNMKFVLQSGENNYFETLPLPGENGDYRIGVFGDPGDLGVAQSEVRDAFLKFLGRHYLNVWILLGDNAYNNGTDAEYQAKFFNPYEKMLKKFPVFPCPGNHDYHDITFGSNYARSHQTTAYFSNFSFPTKGQSGGIPSHNKTYYSFDIGNIHFISLDSYGKEDGKYYLYDTLGTQVQWLKRDLEANKREWVIVYTHFPPYSMGSHNSDTESGLYKIRQNIVPILDRYGVDILICGHSHDYERSGLLYGYYGNEAAFDSSKYDLSYSTGRYDGSTNSCPYVKKPDDKGTVYIVTGSSSYLGKPQAHFPHVAMVYGNASICGAGLIRVRSNRLNFKWICADGIIRDQFTMMKNVDKTTRVYLRKGQQKTLTASFISNKYIWNKSSADGRSIKIISSKSNAKYIVTDSLDCLRDIFEVYNEK